MAFPPKTRDAIRAAVRPGMQAIVSNKAMGMEGTVLEDVPLRTIQISHGTGNVALFIVSWDDSSFGVNGAIWIVEVTPQGERNLVRLRSDQSSGYSLGGFGFEVISPPTDSYPEIMIASSGFRDGGGAEAEDTCVSKTRRYYEKVACPAKCHKTLNGRQTE